MSEDDSSCGAGSEDYDEFANTPNPTSHTASTVNTDDYLSPVVQSGYKQSGNEQNFFDTPSAGHDCCTKSDHASPEERIAALEAEVAKKSALILKLRDHFSLMEGQISCYREENNQLKNTVAKLESNLTNVQGKLSANRKKIRQSIANGLVSLPEATSAFNLEEEDDNDGDSGRDLVMSAKIESFFKLFQSSELNRAELNLHAINSLVSLYHVLYSEEVEDTVSKLLKSDDSKTVTDSTLSSGSSGGMVSGERRASDYSDYSQHKSKGDANLSVSLPVKIAFNYLLEFIRQIYEKKINLAERQYLQRTSYALTGDVDYGYPINWLLSLFPYIVDGNTNSGSGASVSGATGDSIWLPLHFTLAVNPARMLQLEALQLTADASSSGDGGGDGSGDSNTSGDYGGGGGGGGGGTKMHRDYVQHVRLLLQEFGASAFDEDVSPLCVAVAHARPSLEVVKAIVQHRPDSVGREDEDGSLPLMHACACNDETAGLEVIDFLAQCYPDALNASDNFGCSAIHYAAFSGCSQTVRYLIERRPACTDLVEGNGALPLHDAVQNQRCLLLDHANSGATGGGGGSGNGHASRSTEMVEILLKANPMAARKRDDFGAFPLHKAAKSAPLSVFQLVHKVFPNAIFAVDSEGLLPMHYYSQREDKDLHLGLLQYILQANPKSQVLSDDASLFANNGGVTAAAAAAGGKGSQEGGWFSRITSWRGGPASSTPAATSATSRGCDDGSEGGPATSADAALIERTAAALAAASITSRGSPPSTRGGGGQLKGGHVRRKTVRPVRASIHAHYN